MVSYSFLILLLVIPLFYFIILVKLLKRNRSIAFAMIIIPIFLFIVLFIGDLWGYNIHIKRADTIRQELSGMSIEQLPTYFENNKKRLHIRDWHRFEQNTKTWFTLSLDPVFSFRALFKGEGGLVIHLDEHNKFIKDIDWFI